MTTALVTGAGGLLGRLLVEQLVRDGFRVVALVRSDAAGLPNVRAVDLVVGDIRDARVVRQAAERADLVFHLAALVHSESETTTSVADHASVNIEGSANLVSAVKERRSRVIFFSTINVYGPAGRGEMNETSECRPLGPYATTKREAEVVLQDLGERVTILRLASVFGRTVKGNYARLIRAICRGRFVRIGSGHPRKTVIHEIDVLRAAALVASSPNAGGEIYNLTDGETHPIDEIVDAIAAGCGVTPPRLRVPSRMARVAARTADMAAVLIGRPPRMLQTVDKYLEDVVVSGRKIQQHLGFRPEIELQAGWRLALQR